MLKVVPVITVCAALWIGVVLCGECLYQNQVWGDADPSFFYYCNTSTNQSEIVNCAVGSGFVSNATASGCIPWSDWSDNCIDKTELPSITCENNKTLKGSGNPEYFYMCVAQNSTATATLVELECESGRGFYGKNNYLGCYPWALWRNITGCVLE